MRFVVREDVRPWLVPLLNAAAHRWAGYATHPLAMGRGGAQLIAAHDVVVRPYRRGGLPGRLWHDTYFGWDARPFRELQVTAALRARGAPVIEVYGAAVERLRPGCYRGWLASRYVHAARTLWEWASAMPPAVDREAVLRHVGHAIRRVHECGARHPDLNANNILLCAGAEPVLLIDFDRARLAAPGGRQRERDLDRLWRSLRKLDPDGRCVTAAEFGVLRTAYREGAACV